jgi:hypothetical protein
MSWFECVPKNSCVGSLVHNVAALGDGRVFRRLGAVAGGYVIEALSLEGINSAPKGSCYKRGRQAPSLVSAFLSHHIVSFLTHASAIMASAML